MPKYGISKKNTYRIQKKFIEKKLKNFLQVLVLFQIICYNIAENGIKGVLCLVVAFFHETDVSHSFISELFLYRIFSGTVIFSFLPLSGCGQKFPAKPTKIFTACSRARVWNRSLRRFAFSLNAKGSDLFYRKYRQNLCHRSALRGQRPRLNQAAEGLYRQQFHRR